MRFSAMAAATVVVLVVAGAIAYFAVSQSTEVNVAQAATLAAQDPAAARTTPRPVSQPRPDLTAQNAPAPQPSASPPPVPVRTEILTFDNWVVTCNEFAEGPSTRQCAGVLRIVQQNNNQAVFAWSAAIDAKNQATAIIQTPTGVKIASGVELKVGKSAARKFPFSSCDTGSCVAVAAMDAGLLREMTSTATAEAVIQSSQGNAVQFNIQLKGFDRAYAALSKS
jgi:invasion protein IalB